MREKMKFNFEKEKDLNAMEKIIDEDRSNEITAHGKWSSEKPIRVKKRTTIEFSDAQKKMLASLAVEMNTTESAVIKMAFDLYCSLRAINQSMGINALADMLKEKESNLKKKKKLNVDQDQY